MSLNGHQQSPTNQQLQTIQGNPEHSHVVCNSNHRLPDEHQKWLVAILSVQLLVQRCSTGLWTHSCTFGYIRRSIQCDFLLFEIASVLFIHKHQIEIVLHTELVVYILVCGCQVIWRQEKPVTAAKTVSPTLRCVSIITCWHFEMLACSSGC